jgi:hypothetical protein
VCYYIQTEILSVTVMAHNTLMLKFTRPVQVTFNSSATQVFTLTYRNQHGEAKQLRYGQPTE